MSTPADPTTDQDCRRLGLRCVDCLPKSQWCDLCTETHARAHEGEHVHWVHQVEQRNRDWGYDTLDVVTDFGRAQFLAQHAANVWAFEHDREREELFWTSRVEPASGRIINTSWGDVFRITTYALTFDATAATPD